MSTHRKNDSLQEKSDNINPFFNNQLAWDSNDKKKSKYSKRDKKDRYSGDFNNGWGCGLGGFGGFGNDWGNNFGNDWGCGFNNCCQPCQPCAPCPRFDIAIKPCRVNVDPCCVKVKPCRVNIKPCKIKCIPRVNQCDLYDEPCDSPVKRAPCKKSRKQCDKY